MNYAIQSRQSNQYSIDVMAGDSFPNNSIVPLRDLIFRIVLGPTLIVWANMASVSNLFFKSLGVK